LTTLEKIRNCTAYRGRDGLRASHKILQDSLPEAKTEFFNKLVDGEFAFLEWQAKSDNVEMREGADSFVIRDGRIRGPGIATRATFLEVH
jgi:hypothetical protein